MSVWIIVGAWGLAGAALAYKNWPRSREDRYAHGLTEIYADMAERGLTPAQQTEELAFRRAMPVLRRRVSDAVRKNPTGELRELVSTVAAEVSKQVTDKDVTRRFLKVARDAPFADTPSMMMR